MMLSVGELDHLLLPLGGGGGRFLESAGNPPPPPPPPLPDSTERPRRLAPGLLDEPFVSMLTVTVFPFELGTVMLSGPPLFVSVAYVTSLRCGHVPS